jgi:predicted amidophosphoribosyltransferase
VAPPWRPSGIGPRATSWRRCRACRLQAPGFGRLLALDDYPGDLRPWVLALKHGRRELAAPLAKLLAEHLRLAGWVEPAGPTPWLVPVPAHVLRRLERGFDAPRQLAVALGRELDWPTAFLLRRRRATAPQGEPGASSRTANVAGAFGLGAIGRLRLGRARRRGELGPVVLVDDVGSSGATLAECARKLRQAGVSAVGAVCLARAQRAH